MKRARKNFWLVNKAPARKRRRTVQKARRTKAKRRPPLGFRTWKAYMDSIRPNKGGSVAKRRRRRRRNTAAVNRPRRRRRRRNPGTSVALANPRRRYRRRRNPVALVNRRRRRRNPSFSVRGLVGEMKQAGVTAGQVIAGKVVTRIVRARVLPDRFRGTYTQIAAELAIATAAGYASGMVLGPRAAANIMAGGYVGALESLIHQVKALKFVSDAISDDSNPSTIMVPADKAAEVAGYVQGLGGYVPPGLQGIQDRDADSYSNGSIRELQLVGVNA